MILPTAKNSLSIVIPVYNSAEILPNVSPVDISSVAYAASVRGYRKSRVTGQRPSVFVRSFTSNSPPTTAGAAMSAGTDTNDPARMK